MQFGPQVDDREAYVDAVLLNVYGGPGVTNVWIDDLEVAGPRRLGARPAQSQPVCAAATRHRGAVPLVPVRLPPVGRPAQRRICANAGRDRPRRHARVRLDRSVLTVNDRPMFPRVIQHRGEPLATLKKLGFNAVWLQRLPAPEMLEEADRLGLWLICPPPRAIDAGWPKSARLRLACWPGTWAAI